MADGGGSDRRAAVADPAGGVSAVRLYLAGGERQEDLARLVAAGVPFVALSFFWLDQFRTDRYALALMRAYPEVAWFVDPDLARYASARTSRRFKALPSPIGYANRYAVFAEEALDACEGTTDPLGIIEAGADVDSFPELDLELGDLATAAHGTAPTWRAADFNTDRLAWDLHCGGVVPVLVAATPHRLVGAVEARRNYLVARRAGKLVYALGDHALPPDDADLWFDMAGTTAWRTGHAKGLLYVFHANALRTVRLTDRAALREVRPLLRKAGFDPAKVEADDEGEVRRANLHAWRRMQVRCEQARVRRARAIDARREA